MMETGGVGVGVGLSNSISGGVGDRTDLVFPQCTSVGTAGEICRTVGAVGVGYWFLNGLT